MKKTKLISILFILKIICTSLNVFSLENDTAIIKKYIDNVYYSQVTNGNLRWSQYATFTANNRPSFCIGPGKSVISAVYNSSNDWSIVNIPFSKIKEIELIGQYGYNYENHNTFTYYLATQKLLWEALGVDNVYYSDAGYGGGNIFELDSELNEINNLISKHYIKPSFDGILLRGFIGDIFVLIDRNSEIHKFKIDSQNNHNIDLTNDVLSVILDSYDNNKIILKKGDKQSVIYTSLNSQPMADLGTSTIAVFSEINIEVLEGIVNVNFNYDEDVSFENATYKIEKLKYYGEDIDTGGYIVDQSVEPIVFSIDDKNKAKINNMKRGRYQLTQITSKKGFYKDLNKYLFIVDEEHIEQTIVLEASVILNNFIINKYINDEENNICKKEAGIQFDIYNNDVKEGTLFTNEDGHANVLLKYGTYTIKQINSTEGYEKVDDFTFVFENENEDKIYNLITNKIKEETKIINNNEIETKIDENIENLFENSNETISFVMPKTTKFYLIPIILLLMIFIFGIVLIIKEIKNEK